MTRRRREPGKKQRGGALMGMRSGVQKVAGKVTGAAGDQPAPTGWKPVVSNVVFWVLMAAAAALFLRKFGVIRF
jgi:hypothetical protein